MSRRRKLLFPVLLLAVGLVLASCGGSGSGGSGGMRGIDHGGSQQGGQDGGAKKADGGMAGTDHSNMDHDPMQMGSGGMAREMVMVDGEYSDRAFIDAMVPHHQGAIDMAEVALENAEHREIRSLAEDIVSAQEAEIERLKSIKREGFGTSKVPMEMSTGEMEMMGMMADPRELANEEPFDRAFIDSMIPHHRSAIDMAGTALENSENPEIREIAGAIVDAQEREIARMQRWREEWYPEG